MCIGPQLCCIKHFGSCASSFLHHISGKEDYKHYIFITISNKCINSMTELHKSLLVYITLEGLLMYLSFSLMNLHT